MQKKPIGLELADGSSRGGVSDGNCRKTGENNYVAKAPISIKMAKVAINNGINCDLKIGVQFEAEAYTSTFVSADRVEGMMAFVEKRPAEFKNR